MLRAPALAVVAALVALSAAPVRAVEFTVVALPDTQNYASRFPEVFFAQIEWIVANREAENIVFVTHLGDVVNNGPRVEQWQVAKRAMSLLDPIDLPYGVAMGNHDNQFGYDLTTVDNGCIPADPDFEDIDCTGSHFLHYFGPEFYSDRSWYGGASPTGLSSFQTISPGGWPLLFLHLEVDPREPEVAWARQVVEAHPDHVIFVTTHRYMYDYRLFADLPPPLNNPLITGGRFNFLTYLLGNQGLFYETAVPADDVFDELSQYGNLFMIQCGHVDAEFNQVSQNVAGLDVHEILADFQSFSPLGGNGWLRLIRFDLDETTGAVEVAIETFSPVIDQFRPNCTEDPECDALEASVTAVIDGFDQFRDFLPLIGVDPDATEMLLEDLTNEEGRTTLLEGLYGDGSRDSHWSFDTSFADYVLAAGGSIPPVATGLDATGALGAPAGCARGAAAALVALPVALVARRLLRRA